MVPQHGWNHISTGVAAAPSIHPSPASSCRNTTRRRRSSSDRCRNIFAGSPHGLVEGPHLLKRDGWYYLTTAEGGTGYDHAVTMARSRDIGGPYELHPDTHVITSKDAPEAVLQRAGHGQIVETPEGAGLSHASLLGGPCRECGARRSAARRRSRNACGARTAGCGSSRAAPCRRSRCRRRRDVAQAAPGTIRHDFDGAELPLDFQWLRTPYPERLFSLTEKPGALRLFGREIDRQLVRAGAGRAAAGGFSFRAETELDFAPENFQQAAGLTHYYNRHKFHFLAVTHDARLGRVLTILSCPGDWPNGKLDFPLADPLPLRADGPIGLAAEVAGDSAAVLVSATAATGRRPDRCWTPASFPTRAAAASMAPSPAPSSAWPLSTRAAPGIPADFDYFSYTRRDG